MGFRRPCVLLRQWVRAPRERRARGVEPEPSPRWRIARATSRTGTPSRRWLARAPRASVSIAATTRATTPSTATTRHATIDAHRHTGTAHCQARKGRLHPRPGGWLMLAKGDRVGAYILSKKVQENPRGGRPPGPQSKVLQADERVPRPGRRAVRPRAKFLGHI